MPSQPALVVAPTTCRRLHFSENPAGASPAAIAAAKEALRDVNRYPDPTYSTLIEKLAEHYGVDRGRIAVGNGVDEIILMLALVRRSDSRPAVVNGCTFQSHSKSLRAAGIPYFELPLVNYTVSVERLVESLEQGAGLAFVCNPHNPTGSILSPREVRLACSAAQQHKALLVFDEAYAEYVAETDFSSGIPWAARDRHVCVMRTFSKAYGLAGLRVGYLIGDPAIVAELNYLQGAFPFHVNRLAQAAATKALDDRQFLDRTRRDNLAARDRLCEGLGQLGVEFLPSHANFVLARLPGRGSWVTAQLWRRSRTKVRDTSDMGLPDHIRISISHPDEMTEFLRDLEEILGDGHP